MTELEERSDDVALMKMYKEAFASNGFGFSKSLDIFDSRNPKTGQHGKKL